MAHSIKIKQNYHDIFSIIFIGLLLVLSIIKTYWVISLGSIFSWQALALISLILLLGCAVFLFYRSKFKLKIGKNKVSIKIDPIGWTKIKFPKDKIEDFAFFNSDPITNSSGLFVHFGSKCRVYSFGDNSGMKIWLNDGRQLLIFSDELYDQRNEIAKMLGQKLQDQIA